MSHSRGNSARADRRKGRKEERRDGRTGHGLWKRARREGRIRLV